MGGHNIYIPTAAWFLIMEFETNKSGSITPSISSLSGEYRWEFDGSYYYATNPTFTGDGSTYTVKLWGRGNCSISRLYIENEGVIATNLDLTHDAFKTCGDYRLYGNTGLQGLSLPSVVTVALDQFQAYSCGITGTIDLSMFQSLLSCNIQVHLNSGLTSLLLPNPTSGQLTQLWANNTAISSIDISNIDDYWSFSQIRLNSMSSLTSVTLPSSFTNPPNSWSFNASNSVGHIDFAKTGIADKNDINFYFAGMGLTQSEVDQYLADIDSVSDNSYTGRVINLSSNTAPSASGLASKASLESKGFTVTVDT